MSLEFKKLNFKKFSWCLIKNPVFLKKYNWTPKLCFKVKKYIILVDVLYTNAYPHLLYNEEVVKVLRENRFVRVCIFISEKHDPSFILPYCLKNNIGLKNYNIYGDIETLVELDLEKSRKRKKTIKRDEGWFPSIILAKLQQLKNLKFRYILMDFARDFSKLKTKEKQLKLLCQYIDRIFTTENKFEGDKQSFVNLALFESFLEGRQTQNSDHVFHSFRVFIIGCIIIDEYYSLFKELYSKVFPKVKSFSIEYIWALTSIFHDVGYIKQNHLEALGFDVNSIEPQDIEKYNEALSTITSKASWQKQEYQETLENIVCLISKLQYQRNIAIPFMGIGEYTTGLRRNNRIENYLIDTYNSFLSHSVISCFDTAADIIKRINSLGIHRTKRKAFLFGHLYLAAISICYHDWHLWEELTLQKIFPLNFERYPFAALLIYIDTWDDYKRDKKRNILIDAFTICRKEFIVSVTWKEKEQYLKERIKYDSFKKAIIFPKYFSLKIHVSNEY